MTDYGLVTVIIPSYNRFKYLLNAIKSIKEQTYANVEIIVINDGSTEQEYYSHNFVQDNVQIIHLEVNSRKLYGFVNIGYVRNVGMANAKGKYIAFCDDDDIWFPHKLEVQLPAMVASGCKMSCTEGLIGKGTYNSNIIYQKYNSECNYQTLQNIYRHHNSNLLYNGFPDIWTSEFLDVHNCCVVSSVIIETELLKNINYMKNVPCGQEDYDCWKRTLRHTNCLYVKDTCFYYDVGHGDGQNY